MINLVGHTLKDGTLNYTFCKVCRKILLDNVERKDFRIFNRATVLSMQEFISYVKKNDFWYALTLILPRWRCFGHQYLEVTYNLYLNYKAAFIFQLWTGQNKIVLHKVTLDKHGWLWFKVPNLCKLCIKLRKFP